MFFFYKHSQVMNLMLLCKNEQNCRNNAEFTAVSAGNSRYSLKSTATFRQKPHSSPDSIREETLRQTQNNNSTTMNRPSIMWRWYLDLNNNKEAVGWSAWLHEGTHMCCWKRVGATHWFICLTLIHLLWVWITFLNIFISFFLVFS